MMKAGTGSEIGFLEDVVEVDPTVEAGIHPHRHDRPEAAAGARVGGRAGGEMQGVARGRSGAAAAAGEGEEASGRGRRRGGARVDRRVVDSAAEICEALSRRHPGMLVLDPAGTLVGRFGLDT